MLIRTGVGVVSRSSPGSWSSASSLARRRLSADLAGFQFRGRQDVEQPSSVGIKLRPLSKVMRSTLVSLFLSLFLLPLPAS